MTHSALVGALCAALISLQASAQSIGTSTGFETQLPALTPNNQIAPLSLEQLGPKEKVDFAKLPPGSAQATKFLHTRGYLRYARLVADKKLEPKKLPRLPERENWDRNHLSAEEQRIVDLALGLHIRSGLKELPSLPALAATAQLPAIDADEVMSPLTPKQLNAAERKTFATLKPGSPEATKFLYTRGFLRYAKLVVDKKIEPLRLPRLPERQYWDRAYYSEAEAKGIVDVALGMSILAMMKPPE